MHKNEIRELFPHTANNHIYLNHAAISPMSDRVKQALESFLADRNGGNIDNYPEWIELTEETRELISTIIGAESSDRITFMGNTSDALSAVAEGLNWKQGDEIILNTMEFPSNVQPFRVLESRGVKIKYLKPDDTGQITPEMIEDAITTKTKLLSISFVQYLNGFRADLQSIGEICKENDVFFVVDGIQGLGVVPLNVSMYNIDALASGCHKWLMSPMGISFLYLSEKLSKQLQPAKTGWLSVVNPWELSTFDQEWLPVSQHLETGTINIMGIVGLNASLKFMMEIGIESIEKEVLGHAKYILSNLLQRGDVILLTPTEEKSHAGIITFKMNSEVSAGDIVDKLKLENITISARQGFIRISPHFYNTEKELQKVLESII